MADSRFVFPMTFADFQRIASDAEAEFECLGDHEDPIRYAFSCLQQGWKSKMYHKDNSSKQAELNKRVRARMKSDPEFRRLMELDD